MTKEIDGLNNLDTIDIYRTLHPITTECTFLSSAYKTFFRIDRMLGHEKTGVKVPSLTTIVCSQKTITKEKL